ncbi:Carboxylesterase, partial [Mycena floridula]
HHVLMHFLSFSLFFSLVLISKAAQVTFRTTTIHGSDDTVNGLEFFGGIPFAQPPTGTLRFYPPIPKYTLDGQASLNTSSFGPICLQQITIFGIDAAGPQSEDCLTVNILRPSGTQRNDLLPVMF